MTYKTTTQPNKQEQVMIGRPTRMFQLVIALKYVRNPRVCVTHIMLPFWKSYQPIRDGDLPLTVRPSCQSVTLVTTYAPEHVRCHGASFLQLHHIYPVCPLPFSYQCSHLCASLPFIYLANRSSTYYLRTVNNR